MNGFGKIFIFSAVVALISYVGIKYCDFLFGLPPVPTLKEDEWWGPGKPKNVGESIAPFKIDVSPKIIEDLNSRLDRYLKGTPTPPLENQGFQYGFNTNYLKEVVSHWRNNYRWKERQAYLNQFPQYKTSILGLDIHFIMVKPRVVASGVKILPLLLLHGWPGSVREFYEVIPLLITPRERTGFVFQVIAPSLPGYGFSSGSSKPGMGPAEIAVVMKKLMGRLGFDKFYVQGGDWGAAIANRLGILYPDSVLGIHSNFCFLNSFLSNLKWFLGSLAPSLITEEKYQSKLYPISGIFHNLLQESGYAHIHATKPDTIGAALYDNPIGLAAYILEKFSTWTNPAWRTLPDGGLTRKFTLDTLLDNVMIYWISGCITTSQRLYAEVFTPTNRAIERMPVRVPVACARFGNEVVWQAKCQLREKFVNLLRVSDFEDGGHFAALEMPETFAYDVWSAVETFEEHHRKTKSNAKA